MIIIVESLLDSGVAGKLGGLLFKLVGKSEKTFLLIVFISASFFSLFSMLAAIAVPMAIEIGCNPRPVAMACVFGCSLAMATPVATTTITMVQVAGYRLKDYFRIGGLVGLIALFTAWVSIILIYGLI